MWQMPGDDSINRNIVLPDFIFEAESTVEARTYER